MPSFLTRDDYKVELEIFEGPLDLLLYLIRKDEVNVHDIPISRITEQYVEYLELMKMLDLNIAGEFVLMAATLMHIKSRMLLPPADRPEDEDEGPWGGDRNRGRGVGSPDRRFVLSSRSAVAAPVAA